MDERFSTPRAMALSSRSNCSFGSSSSNERWATPRISLSSARSQSSFATARSQLRSPMTSTTFDTVQIHSSHTSETRDRTRDFRRFHQPNSYSRQTYDMAESGRTARKDDGMLPRSKRSLDIHSLARHGRAGELEELLLQGISVESRDENGNSILSIGCQNGSKRIVKLALRYGADIDATNSSGNTALHFAFKYGFGESLGRYLISKGAATNLRNHEGRTYTEV